VKRIYSVSSTNCGNAVLVLGFCKFSSGVRVEGTEFGVKPGTVILGQLCPERVDGNVDCSAIGFELVSLKSRLGFEYVHKE